MSKLITRRGIIGGLIGLVAAPSIVRADSLMKLRGVSAFASSCTISGTILTIGAFHGVLEPGMTIYCDGIDWGRIASVHRVNDAMFELSFDAVGQ